MELLSSILLGAIGTGSLWGFYRALQLHWPEQYSSLHDTFALKVSQTWWRFLAFRFMPMFIASVALAVTAGRIDGAPGVAVGIMAVAHVCLTNVRAIIESFRRTNPEGRIGVNYSPFQLASITLAAVAAYAGWLAAPGLATFIPQPMVLIESVWIAVFVAIMGAIAVSAIGTRPDGSPTFGPEYFIDRATKDVGIHIVDAAYTIALEEKCDPLLLRAIMFTESLQRPKWFRAVERAKGRLLPRGSYGVTQEKGEQPHSDETSLRITAQRMRGAWVMRYTEYAWVPHDGLIWKYAAEHNPDPVFISTVQEIYGELLQQWSSVLYWTDGPINPYIHSFEIRRYAHEFGIRGFTVGHSIEVTIVGASGTALWTGENSALQTAWAFEIQIPVETESVRISIFDVGRNLLDSVDAPFEAASVR